jgi:hypothetical protein
MGRKRGKLEAPRAAVPGVGRVRRPRRSYPEEFKREAVQMLLDGHTAASVVERLGLSGAPCCIAGSKTSSQRPGLRPRRSRRGSVSWSSSCTAWSGSATS